MTKNRHISLQAGLTIRLKYYYILLDMDFVINKYGYRYSNELAVFCKVKFAF